MKTRCFRLLLSLGLIAILLAVTVRAQGPPMNLKLGRLFGYGGFGGELQGVFRLSVSVPNALQRVVFYLDGQPIGEVSQAPFQLQASTDEFPPGRHTFVAVGYTSGGIELHSNEVYSYFLTAEEAGRATRNLIVSLLGGIFGLMALAFLISALLSRGQKPSAELGQPRHYGLFGGAICPKCRRPFGRHWWGLNMVMGRLDRCPFCGKWSVMQSASREALAAAAADELQQAARGEDVPALSEDERRRRELEDSRFQDA